MTGKTTRRPAEHQDWSPPLLWAINPRLCGGRSITSHTYQAQVVFSGLGKIVRDFRDGQNAHRLLLTPSHVVQPFAERGEVIPVGGVPMKIQAPKRDVGSLDPMCNGAGLRARFQGPERARVFAARIGTNAEC